MNKEMYRKKHTWGAYNETTPIMEKNSTLR